MQPSEQGHWYERDGSPAYITVGKKGQERPTTLRDARKKGYVPSVTTVLKAIAKPGLERWKAEQLLMAALTLPRKEGEIEADWIGRVYEDAQAQAIAAAERGTEIHGAIEAAWRGDEYDESLHPFVVTPIKLARNLAGNWLPEKSFASPWGYGGKVDLHSPDFVLDFKTKDGDLVGLKCYDEHFMQVAAYAHGLGRPEARCGIIFVSRTDPGMARLVMHTPEESAWGWRAFLALLRYWQASNEYAPIWANVAATEAVAT